MSGLLSEIRRGAQEVKAAGGDLIVFAGDVFHVRGSVSPTVLNATIDTLEATHKEFGTRFVIIPGNHDLEGKETTRLGSAVTALGRPFVDIVNEPAHLPDIQAVLIPWFENVADLKMQLEKHAPIIKASANAHDAIIHAPIDGVIEGLPPHGLDPEYLASLGYRRIYAGHYHHHKVFHGGAVSIGALAHHSWSDIGSLAGFLLVEPVTGSFRRFASHLPQFIDLTRLDEVDPEDYPLLVDKNYVRVRVESPAAKEVEAARAELLAMGAAGVLIQPEPKPPADVARAGGATIKAGASLEVSVSDFVTGMKLTDPEAVIKAALDVLSAVPA